MVLCETDDPMHANAFSDEELTGRLARVRHEMHAHKLDIALLSTPENIFYLTGLDHWGYFAPHLLIVPLEGELTLITRAMERVTIENQVRNARFEGHAEHESAADAAVRRLPARAKSSTGLRIGVESWSYGHSYGLGTVLRTAVQARHSTLERQKLRSPRPVSRP